MTTERTTTVIVQSTGEEMTFKTTTAQDISASLIQIEDTIKALRQAKQMVYERAVELLTRGAA